MYYIIYSYKYLASDLIKHCHVIFIHSLGQPLIVRSHSKIHRSRGNPKEIFPREPHVFSIIVTSLDSTDNKHGVQRKKKCYILYRIFSHSRRYSTKIFDIIYQLSPLLGDLTFLWETNRRITLQQG